MSEGAAIRRILIYRIGSLGDTVVALPALHRIAEYFPHAERVLLTNYPIKAKAPASAAVLEGTGLVHDYMRYSIGTRSPRELVRLALEIRRFRPELMIYLMPVRPLQNVRRDALYFRQVCGVPQICGLPEEEELQHRLDAKSGLWESEAARLGRCIAELGPVDVEDPKAWNLHLSHAEEKRASQALAALGGSDFFVCSPGCKMQSNDWEDENWRELLRRIGLRGTGLGLVTTGAGEEAERCSTIAEQWPGRHLNLAGRLTPREVAAVFRRARFFLGPDSGPKHLAGAVGTPCVCIFSARNLPGVWFPPGKGHRILYHQPACAGCGLEVCTEMQKLCLRQVSVDEAESAIDQFLAEERALTVL